MITQATVVAHASIGGNQPLYSAFFFYCSGTQTIHSLTVCWARMAKPLPVCLWMLLKPNGDIHCWEPLSTKHTCSPLEDRSCLFLEGAAVNHEWQWYVIVTSLCQILERPLLFLPIYHWHYIIKTTNVGDSHPVQNMKQMRWAVCGGGMGTDWGEN